MIYLFIFNKCVPVYVSIYPSTVSLFFLSLKIFTQTGTKICQLHLELLKFPQKSKRLQKDWEVKAPTYSNKFTCMVLDSTWKRMQKQGEYTNSTQKGIWWTCEFKHVFTVCICKKNNFCLYVSVYSTSCGTKPNSLTCCLRRLVLSALALWSILLMWSSCRSSFAQRDSAAAKWVINTTTAIKKIMI